MDITRSLNSRRNQVKNGQGTSRRSNISVFGAGRDIAQFVGRPTVEKPDAIQTRVRVPGAARHLVSLKINVQRRLSYGVRTDPVCKSMHQRLSVWTLQIISTGSHIIVWTHDTTAHTNSNGSAVLAAEVPYLGKTTPRGTMKY